MKWYRKVALGLAIPLLMNPLVLVWYLNIGGIVAAVRQGRRQRKDVLEEALTAAIQESIELTEAVAQERPAEKELVGTRL